MRQFGFLPLCLSLWGCAFFDWQEVFSKNRWIQGARRSPKERRVLEAASFFHCSKIKSLLLREPYFGDCILLLPFK